MRVLHLISQSPDFTGSGKFIQQMICQSRAKGHDNFLLAGAQVDFQIPGGFIEPECSRFVRFDGKDLDYPIPGMSNVMPYQSTVFSTLAGDDLENYKTIFKQKIKAAIEEFKPDILHTHHLWLMTALAREVAPELPMVTTCHGTCLRQHAFCPELSKEISNRLGQVDQVIALSREQRRTIVDTLPITSERIQVISGGFDQSCFYPGPKPDGSVVEMVYAGKLSHAKGLPWLLKSLKRIENRPFRLHIAGTSTGEEKETCLALASELGDKCEVHGMLSHSELAALMRRAHLFILPSFFEGLPLVLMEALACGCRIVSTALPGVKEIFESQDPDLVRLVELPTLETIDRPFKKDEPNLERVLTKTLETALDDVFKRGAIPEVAIKEITGRFTWENIFSRVEKSYFKAVG